MEQHMALDMRTFTTATEIPAVDFNKPKDCAELFYWRMHPYLHGWMESLYRSKGGTDEDFNVSPVRLEPADLDALEAALKAKMFRSPQASVSLSPSTDIATSILSRKHGPHSQKASRSST
jgi:hypothetical protein